MSRPMQIFLIIMAALIIIKRPEVIGQLIDGIVKLLSSNPNG